MLGRSIVVVAGLVAAMPARAGELKPEEAKRFIAGKYFNYTCFEGTTGAGRINADGSVVGTIQVRGGGTVRLVALPTGTIRVQPDSICAREQLRAVLGDAMKTLPERYRKVVLLYYTNEMTMKEIGDAIGVNESRVSQIHKLALKKMAVVLEGEGIHSVRAL